MFREAISIGAAGTQVTSGAASAEVAIPVGASGAIPKYVLLTCATPAGVVHARPVQTGTAATTSNLAVTFGAPQKVLVRGFGFIAYIQGVAASVLNIQPLET